jgi:hypothetical protein
MYLKDSIESSTTLNTVLWKVSKEKSDEQANKLRTKGYFEAENKRLSLDTEVGNISVVGGRPSVSLIIPV